MASATRGATPILRCWVRNASIFEASNLSASCSCSLPSASRKTFPRRTYTTRSPFSTAPNSIRTAETQEQVQKSDSRRAVEPDSVASGERKQSDPYTPEEIQALTRHIVHEAANRHQYTSRPRRKNGRLGLDERDAEHSRTSRRTSPSSIGEDAPTEQPTLFPLAKGQTSMAQPSPREASRKRVQDWLNGTPVGDGHHPIASTELTDESRYYLRTSHPAWRSKESERSSINVLEESVRVPHTHRHHLMGDQHRQEEIHRPLATFKPQHVEEDFKGLVASTNERQVLRVSTDYARAPSRRRPYEPHSAELPSSVNSLSVYDYTRAHPAPRLVYARDATHAEVELSALLAAASKPWGARVAGFDCEWKPSFSGGASESPVALVQIALGASILLLQLSAMRELPSLLRQFLADPKILKAGVGVLDDCKRLYRDYGVSTRGCIELSYLSRSIDAEHWKHGFNVGGSRSLISLARLVHAYERRLLPKNKRVTISNWEAVLSPEQQTYAANDAHVGMALANGLLSRVPQDMDHDKFMFNVIDGHALRSDGTPWSNTIRKKEGPPYASEGMESKDNLGLKPDVIQDAEGSSSEDNGPLKASYPESTEETKAADMQETTLSRLPQDVRREAIEAKRSELLKKLNIAARQYAH